MKLPGGDIPDLNRPHYDLHCLILTYYSETQLCE